MSASAFTALGCSRCMRRFDTERDNQVCTCGAPLLACYDLCAAHNTLTRAAVEDRADDLWRFRELLPVRAPSSAVSLGERATSIRYAPSTAAALGVAELAIKDEGTLPTGSFKARGAAIGVARAREIGVNAFVMPTNGNAGSAWSAYAAAAGMHATIVMPQAAPQVHRARCTNAGAKLMLVEGSIAEAGQTAARLASERHLYNASTLKEPYRIEGKKTLGFEIAQQYAWYLPDAIFFPTGGGVGLIGIYKAFRELQAIGLLGLSLPRLFAVQSSGCAPIVQAWQQGAETSESWAHPHTVAYGINVPKAIGDFIVLGILRNTDGAAIAVDDDRFVEYRDRLVQQDGVGLCLEGACALAGVAHARSQGNVAASDRVLIINTADPSLDDVRST